VTPPLTNQAMKTTF